MHYYIWTHFTLWYILSNNQSINHINCICGVCGKSSQSWIPMLINTQEILIGLFEMLLKQVLILGVVLCCANAISRLTKTNIWNIGFSYQVLKIRQVSQFPFFFVLGTVSCMHDPQRCHWNLNLINNLEDKVVLFTVSEARNAQITNDEKTKFKIISFWKTKELSDLVGHTAPWMNWVTWITLTVPLT